jgi:predicted DNA-binding helix-hairpin-helix protein
MPDCLPPAPTPFWRTRRLYQADRLLQLYGFPARDLLTDDQPNLDRDIDPKAAYALRHLDLYPVEVQTADYAALLRVPGIGCESANKIINERRSSRLTHDDIKKIGAWMNRARFFITCNGKYQGTLMYDKEDPRHLYGGRGWERPAAQHARDNFKGLYRPDLLRLLLADGNGQQSLEDITHGMGNK